MEPLPGYEVLDTTRFLICPVCSNRDQDKFNADWEVVARHARPRQDEVRFLHWTCQVCRETIPPAGGK